MVRERVVVITGSTVEATQWGVVKQRQGEMGMQMVLSQMRLKRM
jgi:hypothetical protein